MFRIQFNIIIEISQTTVAFKTLVSAVNNNNNDKPIKLIVGIIVDFVKGKRKAIIQSVI